MENGLFKRSTALLFALSIAFAQSTATTFAQGFAGQGGYSQNYGIPRSSGFAGIGQRQPTYRQPVQQAKAKAPVGSTMGSLEQMLDAVDSRTDWNKLPVTHPQQLSQRTNQQLDANSKAFPQYSKRELMRVFLEGGQPQSMSQQNAPGLAFGGAPSLSTNNSANTSTAYSNYQTAKNEANQANYYARKARYDTNQWNRKDSASRAEYAANNANYAAQRAEAAAYSGDNQTRSYANLARQAANRARADANQARYNADTIR